MKLTTVIQTLAVCAGVVLGFDADAGIIETQAAVEPGKWTSDYSGGLAYAEKNNTPLFVFWGSSDCGHCKSAEREMNEATFTSWMAERKLVMVFVESDSKVKKWIKKYAKEKISEFPYAAVYWPKNTKGELVLEGFSAYKGNMSAYGADSKDSNAQQIMDAVDFLIPDWDPSGVKPVEPDPPPTPGHTHQWSAWAVTKAATCTADGEQTRTCSAPDCPNAVETQVIKALGHDWGEWEIVTPAAVGVEGQKRRACKRCTATETAVIPAIDPEPERKEVDASVVYKKAKSLSGIVYEDGDLVGTASLSIGKYSSKKRTVKATLKISLFAGGSASASATVTPNEYGDLEGTFNFKTKNGDAMEFALVYNDGEFELVAENDLYSVELGSVNIGGKLETEEMMFSAEMDYELPEDYDYVVDAPLGEPVYVKNGTKFSFDKAPSIKYKKFSEDGWKWYDLVIDDKDGERTNTNSLKLSYKSTTGAFTGSFKVYASNEFAVDEGKQPKLKSYTVKVSGVIVDGAGIGVLKIGSKVVGTCSLD